MIMNALRLLMIPFAILMLFGCNGGMDDNPSSKNPLPLNLSSTELNLTDEGQTFGMDLFSAVSAKEKDKDGESYSSRCGHVFDERSLFQRSVVGRLICLFLSSKLNMKLI